MNEEQVRKLIQEEMAKVFHSDKYHFSRNIQIANGRNIEVGKSEGTMIATEATQKLGFFGATPLPKAAAGQLVQRTAISVAQDVEARAGVSDINYFLAQYGFHTFTP